MNLSNLKEILEAREARAARQQELLLRGGVLISYGLNIPGPVKNAELYRIVFEIGLHKIESALSEYLSGSNTDAEFAESPDGNTTGFAEYPCGGSATGFAEYPCGNSAAGSFAFLWLSPNADAREVKRLAVQVEEEEPLGRLWDMDVLIPGEEGPRKLSRSELGYPKRKCLVCDAPAFTCVRAARHKVPEVLRTVVDRILSSEEVLERIFTKPERIAAEPAQEQPQGNPFAKGLSLRPVTAEEEKFAELTATEALRAILYEVITTPKPGLVDAENNGAHKDMNITTFFDSALAIAPYFKECVRAGISRFAEEPETMLSKLRPLGLQAEEKMYQATAGVNTHKGAIFTMGVLCAAAGWLRGRQVKVCADGILQTAGRICSVMENGSRGIRQEAMNGYPSVREALKILKTAGNDRTAAQRNTDGVRALMRLIALVDDANVIRRKGEAAADCLRKRAEKILGTPAEVTAGAAEISGTAEAADTEEASEEFLAQVSLLDRDLIRENISPGGSADLLAAAYFLDLLERQRRVPR